MSGSTTTRQVLAGDFPVHRRTMPVRRAETAPRALDSGVMAQGAQEVGQETVGDVVAVAVVR